MVVKSVDWPAGVKRTRSRESVLAVLESSQVPLSATQISSRSSSQGEAVPLSTVYRVLDLFVQTGVVTKAAVTDSDKALYELRRVNHRHYAVCMTCRRIISIEDCPIDVSELVHDDDNFQVVGHNLEVFGHCKECKTAKA